MNNVKKFLLKQSISEFIKYDYNQLKLPLVGLAFVAVWLNLLLNRKLAAFNIVSAVYRTGWKGSHWLGIHFSKKLFRDKNSTQQMTQLAIEALQPLPNTAQFFDHPERMLDGIITVLKAPSENEKGALLINYSYYFLMFHKYFDVEAISEDYIIILEPSWAGFCELGILAYAHSEHDVYVMCYEHRDLDYINALATNIKPLEIGPSWFVNHSNFAPQESSRDIDIIMVAAWAEFKRHAAFFKAISALGHQGRAPKIVLVGYPVTLTKQDILEQARYYGVEDWLTIYESITHKEVSELLNQSKINILWSKFEGNNRAIIEGMFCNTAVIMREGHNYGEHYDFINAQTGCFATEENLAQKVTDLLNSYQDYSPRDYVLNHRSCIAATQIMNKVVREQELQQGRQWTKEMVVKVNELDSMDYFNREEREQFLDCYKDLLQHLDNNKSQS